MFKVWTHPDEHYETHARTTSIFTYVYIYIYTYTYRIYTISIQGYSYPDTSNASWHNHLHPSYSCSFGKLANHCLPSSSFSRERVPVYKIFQGKYYQLRSISKDAITYWCIWMCVHPRTCSITYTHFWDIKHILSTCMWFYGSPMDATFRLMNHSPCFIELFSGIIH